MWVVIAGVLGPLSEKTRRHLQDHGHQLTLLEYPASPEILGRVPDAILCFPFSSVSRRADVPRWAEQLAWLDELVAWATRKGVGRLVLRSSVNAYGSSFKNYGLMEEDRVSLLPPDSLERRWLQAEEMALGGPEGPKLPSVAILRFADPAHPAEAGLPIRMSLARVACPAAGCDPRVQCVSLDDAAEAFRLAVESGATGLFNITGNGCVAFRRALKAAVPVRLPLGHTLQRPLRQLLWRLGLTSDGGEAVDWLQYNVTVSGDRARRELGFEAQKGSIDALEEMIREAGRPAPTFSREVDEFGLDPEYLETWSSWFAFLRKIYWRVEFEGEENLPLEGPALLTANHRGFMPFDGVIHRSLILEKTGRHVRFLVIPSLFKFPFLSDFLIKQGGVVASQLNAERLFTRREFVGIFPEGISGAFRMYKGAYQLGAFGRDAFARLAILHQVPVIPAVVVGHVEIFPILAKLNIGFLSRWTGWPFIPVTPTFPLLPIPLPTKWHVRYLEPMTPDGLRPEHAEDRRKVREFSNRVREVMQRNIDEMLARRKHIFFGKIFDSPREAGAAQISAEN